MRTYTVSSTSVRALCASLTALGLDARALTAQAEIDAAVLADPEARLAETHLLSLWNLAEQRWARDAFGVHAGAALPDGAFELLDYLVGTSPTVGAGFHQLAAYSMLANDGLTYRIEEGDPEAVVVRMQHPYALEVLPPSFVEYLWTLIVTRFGRLNSRLRPTMYFGHAAKGTKAEYARLPGAVVFGAERTELVVPREQWALENPREDPALATVLARHARDVLARLPVPGDELSHVRGALLELLRAGDASVESVARRLNVTVRTLQRTLEGVGYTYNRLLDELRKELSVVFLTASNLSLTEVAYLLGYSDPSAFNRAFKRWTNTTPLAFRESARSQRK